MQVGLLECDHVREDLLHIAGDYRQMFPALFMQVAPDWEFTFYDVCNGNFPKSVAECDLYICTGSKFSVYDEEDWIFRLKDFVKEINRSGRKYAGICFGHQMLAEALGGKVEKGSPGWCVGVHEFSLIRSAEWIDPQKNHFNLLMMCQDQVVRMPEGSVLLAQTPDCPVGMFQVGGNMIGIQAHPEFPKRYNQALMELRVERVGEEKVNSGIASLALPTDELLIAGWIKNFAAL
ncbi:glutamine amidotransferase-related protein [Dyadobacter sp. CY343]|uniref:glutamine amidotransferase-related protein n=1 Tax=Dyadobacter sp. CY343 TaxID=2907299 RepID=UPI001F314654|nr:amidotransferase [Dyadobacter sp. CY343]MCE7058703.1 amidotransferase [Dyadobacter sp. CY343]